MCDISIVSQKCHKKPVFYYPKVSVKEADRANLQRVLVKTTSIINMLRTHLQTGPIYTACGHGNRRPRGDNLGVTTDRW